ncbi:MAG TPA: UbiA-like polyprenyltransferase [Trueperaceae bacterium]|nr:UbiA-like polyprenyltransferase [Trueperaceae bacterium]
MEGRQAGAAARAAASGRPRRDLATYLSLVKIEHSLFALPYAYVGMLLAADGWPGWRTFLLVTLAMVGARTAAMAVNRVVDARLDALNPRTAGREIPSGRLTRWDGVAVAAAGTAALVYAGASLNRLTLALLPVALAFLVAYPYTKRFTWACHLWLGVTIGAAAAGGHVAVTGSFSWVAVLLWLAVAAWVAGFDVIYALLDVAFDRAHGVHSVPARFGVDRAIGFVAALYAVAWLSLLGVGLATTVDPAWPHAPLGPAFTVTSGLVGAYLAQQVRSLLRYRDARAIDAFNVNLALGPLVLLGTVLGLVWR